MLAMAPIPESSNPPRAGLPRCSVTCPGVAGVDLIHALVDLADREARKGLKVEPGERDKP